MLEPRRACKKKSPAARSGPREYILSATIWRCDRAHVAIRDGRTHHALGSRVRRVPPCGSQMSPQAPSLIQEEHVSCLRTTSKNKTNSRRTQKKRQNKETEEKEKKRKLNGKNPTPASPSSAAHVTPEEGRDRVDDHELDLVRLHDVRQVLHLTNKQAGGCCVCEERAQNVSRGTRMNANTEGGAQRPRTFPLAC